MGIVGHQAESTSSNVYEIRRVTAR